MFVTMIDLILFDYNRLVGFVYKHHKKNDEKNLQAPYTNMQLSQQRNLGLDSWSFHTPKGQLHSCLYKSKRVFTYNLMLILFSENQKHIFFGRCIIGVSLIKLYVNFQCQIVIL